MKKFDFYINGEWIKPSGTETADVINPATEEAVAEISLGNSVDVTGQSPQLARRSKAIRKRQWKSE